MNHEYTPPTDEAFQSWLAAHDKALKAQAWAEGEADGTENQSHWDGWNYEPGYKERTNPHKDKDAR